MQTKIELFVFGTALIILMLFLSHGKFSERSVYLETMPQPRTQSTLPGDLEFEIVNTEEARARGLSGRKSMPKNHGMLFVFPEVGIKCMWAKDMLFDLRILFLNPEGELITSDEMKAGSTEPHCSPVPVSLIAEINL